MSHDKPKWQEPLEQWGGHFIALGLVGSLLFGPFNIGLILIRELSPWKFGWLLLWKGQWPPGSPHLVIVSSIQADPRELVTQMDRVEDLRTDLIFQFAGCAVGQAIQLGLLLWLWLS